MMRRSNCDLKISSLSLSGWETWKSETANVGAAGKTVGRPLRWTAVWLLLTTIQLFGTGQIGVLGAWCPTSAAHAE